MSQNRLSDYLGHILEPIERIERVHAAAVAMRVLPFESPVVSDRRKELRAKAGGRRNRVVLWREGHAGVQVRGW